MEITCPHHGNFKIIASHHLLGAGCPKCSSNKSGPERKIERLLESNNISFNYNKKFDDCRNITGALLKFDFYLPDLNLIIEYDGEQHFKPAPHWGGQKALEETKARDLLKDQYCRDNGIKMLRIPYTENIETKLIENGIISSLFNFPNQSLV